MNKDKTIKIIIVVLIVISILGIFIFKGIEKSNIEKLESNKNSITETDIKKDVQVNIYSNENSLPTLVDFGSTSCEPCKEMFPILDSIEEQYKDKLIVKFVNVYTDSVNTRKYNIRTIPTQIFLDADGKIIYRHEGVLYENEIIEKLTEMGVK